MKEFKVIKTNHPYSNLKDKSAYAIVVSVVLRPQPKAERGVYIDREFDRYIIAHDLNDASTLLNEHLTKTIGRVKDKINNT